MSCFVSFVIGKGTSSIAINERERVKEKEGKKKIERDRKSFLERDREREQKKHGKLSEYG